MADAKALAREVYAERELARRRFLPFVQRFVPGYEAGWVHKDIALRLERFSDAVAARKSPRLMLFVPPRHGKSELTSRNFPAWHLGRFPHHEFIACSYSGALANTFSRTARSRLRDPNYQSIFDTRLDPDSQSVEMWQTQQGGQYLAAGVGGPITGFGANVLLIDDPLKNREEASSYSVRQAIWDWYTSTAYTRLAPGGGVVLIMTRWHDDDLAGRLVEEMREQGDQFEIVLYPAIAVEDEPYRRQGEALHPERYDLTALERIRRTIGERDWAALYQQTPVADEGDYFRAEYFFTYRSHERPANEQLNFYTAWDLAIGERQHNDYNVGITGGMDADGVLWITDLVRGRWDSMRLVDEVLDAWALWRPLYDGLEEGQIKQSIRPFLLQRARERELHAFHPHEMKGRRGNKIERARTIQGLMAQGRVRFPEDALWWPAFKHELLRFPYGTHDDQVDAIAWLGLMVEEMVPYLAPRPKPKPSWRDKLARYAAGPERRNHMTA